MHSEVVPKLIDNNSFVAYKNDKPTRILEISVACCILLSNYDRKDQEGKELNHNNIRSRNILHYKKNCYISRITFSAA